MLENQSKAQKTQVIA